MVFLFPDHPAQVLYISREGAPPGKLRKLLPPITPGSASADRDSDRLVEERQAK